MWPKAGSSLNLFTISAAKTTLPKRRIACAENKKETVEKIQEGESYICPHNTSVKSQVLRKIPCGFCQNKNSVDKEKFLIGAILPMSST
jgi:hypothetical protein